MSNERPRASRSVSKGKNNGAPMETWRLLDTPPMTAAENMALDDTLLELKGNGETPNTVRFLQFSPPAALVGFHQAVEKEVRQEYCQAHGIAVNRRITGGGAIFFDEKQLGWEVISEKSFFHAPLAHDRLFRILCDPVIMALRLLGLDASFRPRNDIEIHGRKISGTGGTESGEAFLFQGTLLTEFDAATMVQCLKLPVEKLTAKEIGSLKERVTCLRRELGHTPLLEDIKVVIRQCFEKSFKIKLVPGELVQREKELFEHKLPYYQSSDWIDGAKPKIGCREVVRGSYMGKYGTVQVAMVVDFSLGMIRDVFVTGDFLCFPSRALWDMQARLRGVLIDRDRIYRIIHDFFAADRIFIPGIPFDEFFKPFNQALERIELILSGIPLEYCNSISVTNGSFGEIIRKKPSILLLPYCSKLPTCDLRKEKSCRGCGECSIGDAWALAHDKGMEITCVVNFEDLMSELGKMKAAGIPAFIGCCCPHFSDKHQDDFNKAGIPGILLDIEDTTCYELHQAREAYAGDFQQQTRVNLELLNVVINKCYENP